MQITDVCISCCFKKGVNAYCFPQISEKGGAREQTYSLSAGIFGYTQVPEQLDGDLSSLISGEPFYELVKLQKEAVHTRSGLELLFEHVSR